MYCMCLALQILHADTIQICGSNDTGFVCDGSKSTFRVLFKEPVEIQANTSYIACATLKVLRSLLYSIVGYGTAKIYTIVNYCKKWGMMEVGTG